MPDLARDAEKSRPAKIALRSRVLTTRREISVADRQAAASRLQQHILSLVRREAPATIAAYVPVGTEPGGGELPALLAAHARVLLPVLLADGDLDWAAYEDRLDVAARGLREPPGRRLGVDAIRSAELVLVPALAVDRRGVRMGRGGGSYDRALARRGAGLDRRGVALALLYDGELVEEVPAEPHDRRVDGVVTPSGGVALIGPAGGF